MTIRLQVFYGFFFFGRHYFYKHLWPEAWGSGESCFTFCGTTAKSFFGATDWTPSLQATLFMGNLLYLATLNKSLIIFACDQLPNGEYYLVDAPTVTCYTRDHEKLMLLASASLVSSCQISPVMISNRWCAQLPGSVYRWMATVSPGCFSDRWTKRALAQSQVRGEHAENPCRIEWQGAPCLLYRDCWGSYTSDLRSSGGHVTMNPSHSCWELRCPARFWWHAVVITHKLAIVMTKIFLFNTFYQCPIAICVTLFLLALVVGHFLIHIRCMAEFTGNRQAFARPFESTMLDRLQTLVYSSQFCLLFIGLLFATDKGTTTLNSMLTAIFFGIFWTTVSCCGFIVLRDLKCCILPFALSERIFLFWVLSCTAGDTIGLQASQKSMQSTNLG